MDGFDCNRKTLLSNAKNFYKNSAQRTGRGKARRLQTQRTENSVLDSQNSASINIQQDGKLGGCGFDDLNLDSELEELTALSLVSIIRFLLMAYIGNSLEMIPEDQWNSITINVAAKNVKSVEDHFDCVINSMDKATKNLQMTAKKLENVIVINKNK